MPWVGTAMDRRLAKAHAAERERLAKAHAAVLSLSPGTRGLLWMAQRCGVSWVEAKGLGRELRALRRRELLSGERRWNTTPPLPYRWVVDLSPLGLECLEVLRRRDLFPDVIA